MKINYKTYGDISKPHILLIHGFMGSSLELYPLAEYLSSYFFCILVDLPGHGKSNIAKRASLNNLIRSIAKIVKSFNSPMSIFGYSMGGRIALQLIKKYNHLFNSIIIESSSPGIIDLKNKRARANADKKLLSGIHTKKQFKAFLNKWYQSDIFGNISNENNFEYYIDEKSNFDFNKYKIALKKFSVGNQNSHWKYLENQSKKILYISGENDNKYSQYGKDLSKSNSKITHKIIKNKGHNTHYNNHQNISKIIISFITKKQ